MKTHDTHDPPSTHLMLHDPRVRIDLTNTFTVCTRCFMPFVTELRRMFVGGNEYRNQAQCPECR